jgi:hypothetical protein
MGKIFSVLVFAIILFSSVARRASAKEIRVKNAREFVAAIDSGTIIVLEGDVTWPDYNVTVAGGTGAKIGPGARWRKARNGYELGIEGVNNLTIFDVEGSRGVAVRDATFRNCHYENLSAQEEAVEMVRPNWIEGKGPWL